MAGSACGTAAPVATGAVATGPTGAVATAALGSATADPASPLPDAAVPAAPSRISLPSIDVDAAVVAVGVDDLGEMDVPLDVSTVGWYRFGPGPGSAAGSSVLSGHVDDREQGRGAFFSLTDLEPGDPVRVTLADGNVLDYRVSGVERIDKAVLPVDRLFARDGTPRLTLVTCGGDFDRRTRNYRDNVVVTADPLAAGDPLATGQGR